MITSVYESCEHNFFDSCTNQEYVECPEHQCHIPGYSDNHRIYCKCENLYSYCTLYHAPEHAVNRTVYPRHIIDLISIALLAVSALSLGTVLLNFIVYFPNGFSPSIGAELGLITGILHANKNRI